MAKKKTDVGMDINAFHEAMTCGLTPEMEDMERQLEELVKQNIALENRFNEEHKLRMHERNASEGQQLYLHRKVNLLSEKLYKERLSKEQEMNRKRKSVPGFVIAALTAFVLLIVPNLLQKLAIIGPQLSFAIQTFLAMVIAFCYGIIIERTGK
jgi:hypothetical protein